MTDKKHSMKRTHHEVEEHMEGPVEKRADEPIEMVTLPKKDYAAQLKEIDELKEQAQSQLDGWQRERAEFQNYKKRVERDQMNLRQDIAGSVLKRYLVILDDLNRALKTRPTEGEAGAWSEGVELIKKKLMDILESEGVRLMQVDSELFDPNRHEAISHEDSPDHKSGEIIEVVQQGYMLGDRVLRPAQVRVAR